MSQFTRNTFEREAGRLRPVLLRVAASIVSDTEAEDIVQETLLKLWFLRDRLAAYSSIDAIARVITRNLSINHLRSRRYQAVDVATLPDVEDESDADSAISDELQTAILSLPDTEQAVLRMKHLEGMETEEIASMIHSSPGAVRTALSRARCRIRKLFLPNS